MSSSTGRPGRDDVFTFEDPLGQQSPEDTDQGWSERTTDSDSDLDRLLSEKPPHHL